MFLPTVASGKAKLADLNPTSPAVNIPTRRRTAVQGFTGTSQVLLSRSAVFSGSITPYNQAGTGTKNSEAVYFFYAEDMTISGKTTAQIDADMAALFATQFASGGAYFGDTLQNPTILA